MNTLAKRTKLTQAERLQAHDLVATQNMRVADVARQMGRSSTAITNAIKAIDEQIAYDKERKRRKAAEVRASNGSKPTLSTLMGKGSLTTMLGEIEGQRLAPHQQTDISGVMSSAVELINEAKRFVQPHGYDVLLVKR